MFSVAKKAFALPSIMIASIVMMSVLAVTLSATTATRNALKDQKYTQLSQLAAEAGQNYAKACLANNGNIPQWTNAKPLKPNTDCSGNETTACSDTSTSASCWVLIDGNIKSTFSVPLPPVDSTGRAGVVPSTGSVKLIRTSSGVAWKTYNQSINVTGPQTAGSLVSVNGGVLTSDSTYYYRTFTTNGNLTISGGTLSADILVIGGGGGGGRYGGGGGAGGIAYYSNQSLGSGGYNAVVGGGGIGWVGDTQTGGTAGSGGNSSFGSLSPAIGGGGGGCYANSSGQVSGGLGGSGGGGGRTNSSSGPVGSGSGTSGQGNSGGNGVAGSYSNNTGGGGGGAGASGSAGGTNLTANGLGGVGTAAYSTWGAATGVGHNVGGTYYFAGGGSASRGSSTGGMQPGGYGGGGWGYDSSGYDSSKPLDGLPNTGGGGGGGNDITISGTWRAGNGGSGVVIVRYLKTSVVSNTIVTDGLVLNLDAGNASSYSGTGTTWTDLSGNSNNATLYNSPVFNSSNGGNLTFNGTNNYGEVPNNSSLASISSAITVSAWFKKSQGTGYKGLVDKGRDGYGAWSLNVDETTNKVTFKAKIAGVNRSIVANANYLNDGWMHVVGVFDGTNLSIYQNGYISNSANYPGALGTNSVTVRVGSANDGLYFNGSVSQVLIYNRALSATEVTQNYNAISGRYGYESVPTIAMSGMILNLDAGNAMSYPGTGSVWYDLSSSPSNATLTNGPTFSSPYIQFDGTDDYAAISSNSKFALGTGNFTLEAWINPQSFSNYVHILAMPSQNTFSLKINVTDGAIYYFDSAFTTYGSTSGWTSSLNSWNHIVLVRESGVAYAYLNGLSRGSKASFNSNYSAQAVNIHNGYPGEFAQARISVIRLYNIALTQTQVAQNYNALKSKYGL